jgi:glycosyltransferase involved in cell wall biosynthesis
MPKVSICTIAMNRLHHVQKTLPSNLKENDTPGVGFLLLDYNSSDGLGEYIKGSYRDEIHSGKLVYYRYEQADDFDRCHSRNMALKLAEGDILCNLDADNYAGSGFGQFVQETFSEKKSICLTGLENPWKHDASGKLCVRREDFIEVTGYDESFDGYGFEDFDIVNRLGLNGCEPFTINKSDFLKAISHERNDRLSNESFCKLLEGLYVRFIDPSTSELLYLFKDHRCLTGIIINKFTRNSNNPESVVPRNARFLSQFYLPDGWQIGNWLEAPGKLQLSFEDKEHEYSKKTSQGQEILSNHDHTYYRVSNTIMQLEAISFFTEMKNRDRMMNNLSAKRIKVNHEFGKGIVYKNFNEHEPIAI